MVVACNDLIIQRILEEISNKKKLLNTNFNNLKKNACEHHLTELKYYNNYYQPIREEKQRQIIVLENIAKHLDKLMNTISSNDQVALLKNDKKFILERLTLLKHKLKEISPN